MIQPLQTSNREFHTYQLRSGKPDRIVIRGLHPTIPPEFIKKLSLTCTSMCVPFVIFLFKISIHRFFRHEYIYCFFVDFKLSDLKKDIFQLKRLLNCAIKVGSLHKILNIPQCIRCKAFHHTKSYWHHPPRCLKCVPPHRTSYCTKDCSPPARCAIFQENRTTRYRECSIYKDLQKRRQLRTNLQKPTSPPNLNETNCPLLPKTIIPSQLRHSQKLMEKSQAHQNRNYSWSLQSPSQRYLSSQRDPTLKTSINKNVEFINDNVNVCNNLVNNNSYYHSQRHSSRTLRPILILTSHPNYRHICPQHITSHYSLVSLRNKMVLIPQLINHLQSFCLTAMMFGNVKSALNWYYIQVVLTFFI